MFKLRMCFQFWILIGQSLSTYIPRAASNGTQVNYIQVNSAINLYPFVWCLLYVFQLLIRPIDGDALADMEEVFFKKRNAYIPLGIVWQQGLSQHKFQAALYLIKVQSLLNVNGHKVGSLSLIGPREMESIFFKYGCHYGRVGRERFRSETNLGFSRIYISLCTPTLNQSASWAIIQHYYFYFFMSWMAGSCDLMYKPSDF